MKKLTYIFFMLFSIVTFSQTKKQKQKPKDIDKKVNLSLDSLSKVYKKKVLVVKTFTTNDTLKRYIGYMKDDQLHHELIEIKPIKK